MDSEGIAPIVTISRALESLVDALEKVAPAHRERQASFESSVDRIRRAHSEIQLWISGRR